MNKPYSSLGLMSGTSMDGVDASIIQSDGETKYKVIIDKYFEYPQNIYKDLVNLRDKIENYEDLKKFTKEMQEIEKQITLFHAKASDEIIKQSQLNIDFIGFHGQTIFHNANKKISKQLGDGKLLSNLTNKTIIYNFRQNDLKNGGEGAPLTPVFHQMLEKNLNIKPVSFFNIGGILNVTTILDDGKISAKDEGPGMCLIDKWIRNKSKKKYDHNGDIAKSGKVNKIILDQYQYNFRSSNSIKKSYDTNDFDISLVKNLSLEDGAATLTYLTANILIDYLLDKKKLKQKEKIILCGGGRKNKFLVDIIKKHSKEIKFIDDYGIDGDFIESQAFAYLAVRSYLNLPLSFPRTTNVNKPCTGGVIIKN